MLVCIVLFECKFIVRIKDLVLLLKDFNKRPGWRSGVIKAVVVAVPDCK